MKKLILLFMLLVLMPMVYGELNVQSSVVKDIILPDQTAVFDLTIKNTDSSGNFEIILLDYNWRLKGTTNLNLPSSSEKKTQIELLPLGVIKPGRYSVNLRMFSKTDANNFVDFPVIVKVVAFDELVNASLEYNPQGLDPRKENLVNLNLKNRNNIELNNLKINVKSSLFEDEREITLLPLEYRTEQIKVVFEDEFVERGSYDVSLSIIMDGKTLVDRTEKIQVGYYSDVKEDVIVDKGFLKETITLSRDNDGNVASNEEYSIRLNSFEKLFTSTNPEPSSIENKDGLYYYLWSFKISPGSTYEVEIVTNYRTPLIALIVLVLVLWVLYAFFRTDVSIRKKVLTIKSGEGISDIKVLLILKNRGGPLRHLQVVDRLPKVVKKPAEYGIIKPNNVKHDPSGIILTWDMENLIRGEERVISYRIKSHISIIGKLHVPQAIIRYRNKTKRLVITKSNKNILFS